MGISSMGRRRRVEHSIGLLRSLNPSVQGEVNAVSSLPRNNGRRLLIMLNVAKRLVTRKHGPQRTESPVAAIGFQG